MKNGTRSWVETRTPLPWRRDPSGVFYAREKVNGKDKFAGSWVTRLKNDRTLVIKPLIPD
jgi:hypothetical protein